MKPSEVPYKVVGRDDNEFCGYEVQGPMGDIWAMTMDEAIDRARLFNHVHNVAYRLGQEKMREMACSQIDKMPRRNRESKAKVLEAIRALPIDGEGKGE